MYISKKTRISQKPLTKRTLFVPLKQNLIIYTIQSPPCVLMQTLLVKNFIIPFPHYYLNLCAFQTQNWSTTQKSTNQGRPNFRSRDFLTVLSLSPIRLKNIPKPSRLNPLNPETPIHTHTKLRRRQRRNKIWAQSIQYATTSRKLTRLYTTSWSHLCDVSVSFLPVELRQGPPLITTSR